MANCTQVTKKKSSLFPCEKHVHLKHLRAMALPHTLVDARVGEVNQGDITIG